MNNIGWIIEALEYCKDRDSCMGCPYPGDKCGIDAAIKRMRESTWIDVRDRMPPKNDKKVLTYGNPVTHWMQLPEPPGEASSGERVDD